LGVQEFSNEQETIKIMSIVLGYFDMVLLLTLAKGFNHQIGVLKLKMNQSQLQLGWH
jgi:hypothetical protein